MKSTPISVIFLSIFLFISCVNDKTRYFESTKAGIIEYYKDDSLRLEAARYILNNIEGLKHLEDDENQGRQPYFDYLKKIALQSELDRNGKKKEGKRKPEKELYTRVLDSIFEAERQRSVTVGSRLIEDISYLSQEQIQENIEFAFYTRQNFPWSKKVDFEDFKEYVLPYRVTDAYSPHSKRIFLEEYKPLVDSIRSISDPHEVAKRIKDDIHLWFKEDGVLGARYPFLFPMTFENIFNGRVGTCYEATTLRVEIMRALGIPTAFEIVPHWGNVSARHYFYAVIADKNNPTELITNENKYRDTRHIITGSSYVGEKYDSPNNQIIYNKTVPKVFRLGFAVNPKSLAALADYDEPIPDFFRNDRLKDVTSEYLETASIRLQLNNSEKKTVYLTVFSPDEWQAVDWSLTNNGYAEFKNVGKNIVYLPCYYNGDYMVPAGSPFLLDMQGETHHFSPSDEQIALNLDRKYRLSIHNISNARRSQGIRFSVANKADLSDSVQIMTLDSLILKMTRFPLDNLQESRYIICQFEPSQKISIAELEFIGLISGKETKLKGKVSGNMGGYNKSTEMLFDNDRNTFYESSEEGPNYFVIDLKDPFQLKEIRICPRNDTNDVLPGDTYELFYWDSKWVSLGIRKGIDYKSLEFVGPKNSLYLLKNISRGVEERIFSYHQEKQYFW
ncbi:transglutaminase-like domain-containing protein [Sphingobacterium gobiense]|uniref:Peptide-N(4)-(N-acetyl-beta-glucosaminyl)asparagine amidase n=1 Tax=Sphingobacterium gobiense TaxID=1382456 RepID=A0A2S9JU28_9SPHI|nr:transglutaminase-like domain-containing protein [Sphingobacterium gobiense]PRD56764.1 hypothetical protein C5749_05925 [Sphingobacterium gobiense]